VRERLLAHDFAMFEVIWKLGISDYSWSRFTDDTW
jgi:hypothetical protein